MHGHMKVKFLHSLSLTTLSSDISLADLEKRRKYLHKHTKKKQIEFWFHAMLRNNFFWSENTRGKG